VFVMVTTLGAIAAAAFAMLVLPILLWSIFGAVTNGPLFDEEFVDVEFAMKPPNMPPPTDSARTSTSAATRC